MRAPVFLATLLAGLSGTAFSAEPPRPVAPAALVAPAVSAQNAVPAAKPAADRQDIRAQLSPRRYTTLAAEIGAKVNRLPVAEGGGLQSGANPDCL